MTRSELVSDRVAERYQLYGEIASGGIATVHFGRLFGPGGFARTVAIKRLHPQYAKDPDFVAMFLDEARLAARIQHPNVVGLLDIVARGGELLLVMEYVEGEALAALLRRLHDRAERVPPPIVAAIVCGVLYGLHAAHEATDDSGAPLGVVHRDVSPQNVIVGSDGVAKVIDFGIAKATRQIHVTHDGRVKGKAAYSAPEQLRGDAVDRRTDVFAAGVVLWEALTGRRLFDSTESVEVAAQMLLEPRFAPPSRVIADLPRELDAIFARATAVDKDERFQSAHDMAVALEDALGLASPRIVGAWVRNVAGDALKRRAERRKAIESEANDASGDDLARAGTIAATALLTETMPNAVAAADDLDRAAAATSRDAPPSDAVPRPPRPGSGRRVRAIAALVIATAAAFALLAFRRTGAVSPAADRGSDAVVAAAPAQAEAPPSTGARAAQTEAPAPVAQTSSALRAEIPPLPRASSPSKTDAPARPSRARKDPSAPAAGVSRTGLPGASAEAQQPAACDPPYFIDAAGIKRFKPECL